MSRSISNELPNDSTSESSVDSAVTTGSPFTRRRVVGFTAALVGGVALAVPGVASMASEPAPSAPPAQHISFRADPTGLGLDALPKPAPVAPVAKPTAAEATATANSGERASRSTSRSALPATASVGGSPQAIAQAELASRGWGGQFSCLNSLWSKESGWRVSASNPSGAYGIPQSLPGSKMASAGSDWRTNPATQIAWGLDYISSTYGSPCAAWAHSRANNWY
jgi:hypothetical protein